MMSLHSGADELPLAACPGGVVGQSGDIGVGQVGGLDKPRAAAFSDEIGHALLAGKNGRGVESGFGPAIAQDDVAGPSGGAAEGGPVAEQVPQAFRDDVDGGPLGGGDDRHGGGPAPGDQ